MKKMLRALSLMLALILAMSVLLAAPVNAETADSITRTVMMYCVGSDLESYDALASDNLIQAMESDYNENLNFIVITGGSTKWCMPEEYLSGADEISTTVNQVWKLEGKRSGEEHGMMTLLEPDGICDKPISDPSTLTAFVDYCYANDPADIYDLLMWDHGAGPVYGFGIDNNNSNKTLSLQETVQAFNESSLIKDGKRFDLINYDACLMSSVEVVAALCDYSDYFVCSAEEVPGGGQDYAAMMATLINDPSIGGFDLGKQIVDAFIVNYGAGSENETEKSTLSVIDSDNFKTRLLPLLNTLSEILLSEAKNKGELNGLYNFYDELYSEYAAYENGLDDNYDLFDLGNLLSALGCWQTEADNLSTDAIKNYQNSYTELAADIMTILADDDNSGDDVIYSGSTSDMKKIVTNHNLRAADGTMTAYNDGIPYEELPTGLSIFYPSSDIVPAYDYQDVMTDLTQVLPEGDSRTFFERYTLAVTYYGLIYSFGRAVSDIAADEDAAPTYEAVKAKLQDDELWEDYYQEMLGYLVDCGEFASLDEAEAFFAGIAAQQSTDAFTKEKAAVQAVKNSTGDIESFSINISQTSAHTITGAGSCLRVVAEPDDTSFMMYLTRMGYSYYQRQRYFPDGFVFGMNKEEGIMQTDRFIEDASDSDALIKQRAYGADDVSFSLKHPSDTCLVLYDADGSPHIAEAIYTNEDHTEAAILFITFKKYLTINNYYLYVKKTGESWQIEGLSTSFSNAGERDYIPMDSDAFCLEDDEWMSYTTVSEMTDAYYGETNLIPVSNFAPVDNSLENWGITVSEMKVNYLGLKYDRYYYLDDVYGSVIDISDSVNELDPASGSDDLIDISDAEITVTVDDGTPVVTVTLGDDVLVEDADYIVILGTDVLGKPQATVVGIGRYTGSKTCLYTDPSKEYPYTVLIDGTAAIDSYLGVDTEIVIPSHLDGYTVSAINIGAFFFSTDLKKVTIPDTVTSIGAEAFVYCESLTEIDLGKGVTEIGEHSFYDCDLKKLEIPDSVESIGKTAFSDNKHLTEVKLGKGLTEIPERAFSFCGLTSLNIPENITSIGDLAFLQNPDLKEVYIPATVTEIGSNAFGYLDKSGGFVLVEGFTIIGKAGSAAQAYAEANGIPFIEDKELLLGDVDRDGEVTILDATFIQRKLAGIPISFTFIDAVADADEDKEVTIIDATILQRWLASFLSNDHIGKPIV